MVYHGLNRLFLLLTLLFVVDPFMFYILPVIYTDGWIDKDEQQSNPGNKLKDLEMSERLWVKGRLMRGRGQDGGVNGVDVG